MSRTGPCGAPRPCLERSSTRRHTATPSRACAAARSSELPAGPEPVTAAEASSRAKACGGRRARCPQPTVRAGPSVWMQEGRVAALGPAGKRAWGRRGALEAGRVEAKRAAGRAGPRGGLASVTGPMTQLGYMGARGGAAGRHASAPAGAGLEGIRAGRKRRRRAVAESGRSRAWRGPHEGFKRRGRAWRGSRPRLRPRLTPGLGLTRGWAWRGAQPAARGTGNGDGGGLLRIGARRRGRRARSGPDKRLACGGGGRDAVQGL